MATNVPLKFDALGTGPGSVTALPVWGTLAAVPSFSARLAALMRASADAMLFFDPTTLDVVDANAPAAALFGRAADELAGRSVRETIASAFVSADSLLEALPVPGGARLEVSLERRGGGLVHLAVSIEPVGDGAPPLVAVVLRDVSSQLAAERMLRESEERYGLVAYGANDGLWDWQLVPNKMYFSPRWKSMLGYDESEIGESPNELFARAHPNDVEEMQRRIAAHLEGETPNFEIELRILHKSGEYRWMLVRGIAVRDGDGLAYRMAGSQSDITERRTAQDELVRKALYDGLTGLPNRSLFSERLRHAVELARRRGDFLFAVLFLDLDRFKIVNDSLGHQAGDELLVQIARRLETTLRPTDTFARLGGDEFAILLEGIAAVEDARHVAARVRQDLERPFRVAGHSIHTSASIGIAVSTQFRSPEDMLREADMAMYRAKKSGTGRYEVFDSKAFGKDAARLHVENEIRSGIDHGEFRLFYQPIVSITSRAISGFEALVRWQHPERGLVPPNDFIPVAEESGLIVALGSWVLREACTQAHAWHQMFPQHDRLAVSVNLSSRQFASGDIVEEVREALRASRLPARCLKLEVTETVLMQNSDATLEALEALKALGVRLAIDDFGTGYSSLSYLHRFPFDELKIDRSFVKTIDKGPARGLEIVRTIVELAHLLGLDPVAEGIETEEQLRHLAGLRCKYGQGYLFSKPAPASEAEALLR